MVSIFHATSASALNHVRSLMRGFVAWHRVTHPEDRALIDRYFEPEAFERELAELPGPYVLKPFMPMRSMQPCVAERLAPLPAFAGGEGYYASRAASTPIPISLPAPAAVCGLFIAYHGGEPAGCVALRDRGANENGDGVCEMKRLFVPVAFRGMGLGRALVRRAIAEATQAGYARMRLDTGRRQVEAIHLYEKSGFKRVPPADDLAPDLKSWLIFFERRL